MAEIGKSRKNNRAMSLAELIVGFLLFAIVIIPIFGIIPTAYMSIKKAEDYSTASCYAQEVLELYSLSDPSFTQDDFHNEWDIDLNNTEYTVILDLHALDKKESHCLIDVVVNIYWKKIPEHIQVFRRVYYNE
jgi:exopolysaccharide biosynthesis protein